MCPPLKGPGGFHSLVEEVMLREMIDTNVYGFIRETTQKMTDSGVISMQPILPQRKKFMLWLIEA